jgi:hypothetical protein
MIATMNAKFSGYVWIGSFLNIFDMGPVYSNWDIMFGLTSDGASMAPYTLTIVNNEAEINHVITSLGYAQ